MSCNFLVVQPMNYVELMWWCWSCSKEQDCKLQSVI